MKIDELSDVLKAKDIQNFLGISRGKAYELMRISPDVGGIPSIRIGKSVRVLKVDLLNWLNSRR